MRQRQLEEDAGVDSPTSASIIKNPVLKPTPTTLQYSTHEPLPDIYLRTPEGKHVPELEAQWELNPHARACGDTSGLLGLKPGHYHLKANITATDLCNLAHSDLRSQFYKICPKKKPNPELEPPFSLGKDKVIHNQKRSDSRRQASEAREIAKHVVTRPTVTASPSTLSQHQVRPRAMDEIHQVASAPEPTFEKIGSAPLRDKDLFYTNGNLKPPSTGRLLIRVVKRNRKRLRGRKQERKRTKCRGFTIVDLEDNTPETPETTTEAVEPSQFPNPARDKMLLFSFMKYAIGTQNRDIRVGPTHSPDLPVNHEVLLPEKHPQEPALAIGAACFGPHTALLIQDPLNQGMYDPGKALSRPIGDVCCDSIVLVEKQGLDGLSKFFPGQSHLRDAVRDPARW